MADQLLYRQTLKDGRIKAANIWPGGWQILIYRNQEAFDKEKIEVEKEGKIPNPTGIPGYPSSACVRSMR